MEEKILHQIQLIFLTETEDPIFKLKIIWSSDSHVLVVVNNQIGRLRNIMFLTRSKGKKLTWSGFSNSKNYSVQVYGLKLDTTTGLGRRKRRDINLYSFEGVEKFIIHPDLIPTKLDTEVADMTQAHGQDCMVSSLEDKTEFDIEVQYEPPMDHRLKPTLPPGSTMGLYIVYNEETKKEYLMTSSLFCHSSNHSYDGIPLLPIQHSRTMYKACAIALKDSQNGTFGSCHVPCGMSRVLTIKTCNSKGDLQMLMEKAQNYCDSHSRSPGTYNIRQLYRNKPRRYFDDILNNKGGLMAKYIKDNNGDPYCTINNKIEGLFFSASLGIKRRKPPYFSFFGNTRLFIPAEELITSDTRMYFSDFYCHKEVHYVSLVLTKRGSFEDSFCKGHLLELNLKDNPFLTVQENASCEIAQCIHPLSQSVTKQIFKMASVDKFHVEFLYTEDVDIAGLMRKCGDGHSKNNVYLKRNPVQGRGKSKKNGIPKKATCKICNLDTL